MNATLETLAKLDLQTGSSVTASNKVYTKRLNKIKFPSVNKVDNCIKECKTGFDKNLDPYMGTYFEEGDRSDVVTRDLQDRIFNVSQQCNAFVKPSIIKKVIGSIPLPLFLPIMKKRVLAIRQLDTLEYGVRSSTTNRGRYGEVCTFAFHSEDRLRSLCEGEVVHSDWRTEFQLFETASPERTWSILGYTEEGFETWWRGRRAETKVGDSWADLKALCKSVVFVCDDICSEYMRRLPCIERLEKLANQSQEIAVKLMRQMSLHPEQAKVISILFGFSTPLVFALSRIADKAKEGLKEADAFLSVKAERLLQPISELEPLMQETVNLLKRFGANLRYRPYAVAAKEDGGHLAYKPKPSIAQLFSMCPDELTDEAKAIALETGLAKDEESLKVTVDQIQGEEIGNVAQRIVEDCVDEEDPGFDLAVLRNLGLDEILISDVPLDMLGYGASSVVSLYTSPTDLSKVYAIKHNKMYGKSATWNKVKREASIWVTLKHDNVLPLIGYCMHPTEQYPALVTPVCADGSLNSFLQDHSVSDRKKMDFLHGTASGLAYLHSRKVSHGDLRAANILVDRLPSGETRAVICDFGLSDFFVEVADRLYQPTKDQKTADKWLAPELMFARTGTVARVSSEGDMYAFGCVILEVAFGKEPYHACPPGSDGDAKQRGKLPALKAEMNDVYWPIAEKCWEYMPRDRPTASWAASFLANRLDREDGTL